MNRSILILFILFHLKHFLCDFPLQTTYMLGKGKQGLQWILPLGTHCLVHVAFSMAIIVIFKPEYLWLSWAEFCAHFLIDRIKVLYRLPKGVWKDDEKGRYLSKYYQAFGLDQMAHQLTYVLMIYWMSQ